MTTSSGVQALQASAWTFGRSLRDSLLADYERDYGTPAPAPALIGSELLTDFLGASLSYDALPLTVFAETTWNNGQPLVTVNSRTREIPGVKDPEGVANVGVWHEIVHVQRDLAMLRVGPQAAFEGMVPNLRIACHRDQQVTTKRSDEFRREFFAEEAGRAAAISFRHLTQTEAFRNFIYLADQRLASGPLGWQALYAAAEQIGVNITALVKQLEAEGFLHIERSRGRRLLHPQPGLGDLLVRTRN